MLPAIASNFIKPYPQSALSSGEGLTSVDISKALGARHEEVKKNINQLSEQDQAFSAIAAKAQTGGRPILNEREYITSKEWHEQVKPTASVSNTNKAIRSMETYASLIEQGHIVEVQRDSGNSILESLVVANSYNPVMLIDAVAQKAIEHHFEQTASNAIQSSKESALLGLTGIRLDLIAQDPQTVLMLQMLSRQKELEAQVARVPALIDGSIDQAIRNIGGHAGYMTVLAYARMRRLRISATHAASLGKAATKACAELGYDVHKVKDARFGQINAYPEEILEAVFHEGEG